MLALPWDNKRASNNNNIYKTKNKKQENTKMALSKHQAEGDKNLQDFTIVLAIPYKKVTEKKLPKHHYVTMPTDPASQTYN